MKVLTDLTAQIADADWREARGIVSMVCDEPQPGFLRLVSLGAEGVIIRHGHTAVGVPLSELLRLAEQAEPAMQPPAPEA